MSTRKHGAAIVDLAFLDETRLVTVGQAGELALWSVRRRQPLERWATGADGRQLVLAPSGRRLAAGSPDGRIALWGLDDDDGLRAHPPLEVGRGTARPLAWGPRGERLLAWCDGQLGVYQAADGQPLRRGAFPLLPRGGALDAMGGLIVWNRDACWRWDASGAMQRADEAPLAIDAGRHGGELVGCGWDSVMSWDLTAGEQRAWSALQLPSLVDCCALAEDDLLILTGDVPSGRVRRTGCLWALLPDADRALRLATHLPPGPRVARCPAGQLLAIGSSGGPLGQLELHRVSELLDADDEQRDGADATLELQATTRTVRWRDLSPAARGGRARTSVRPSRVPPPAAGDEGLPRPRDATERAPSPTLAAAGLRPLRTLRFGDRRATLAAERGSQPTALTIERGGQLIARLPEGGGRQLELSTSDALFGDELVLALNPGSRCEVLCVRIEDGATRPLSELDPACEMGGLVGLDVDPTGELLVLAQEGADGTTLRLIDRVTGGALSMPLWRELAHVRWTAEGELEGTPYRGDQPRGQHPEPIAIDWRLGVLLES